MTKKLKKGFESKHESAVKSTILATLGVLAVVSSLAALWLVMEASEALSSRNAANAAQRELVKPVTRPLPPARYEAVATQVLRTHGLQVSVLQGGKGIELRIPSLASPEDVAAFKFARMQVIDAERDAVWSQDICAMRCQGGSAGVVVMKAQVKDVEAAAGPSTGGASEQNPLMAQPQGKPAGATPSLVAK